MTDEGRRPPDPGAEPAGPAAGGPAPTEPTYQGEPGWPPPAARAPGTAWPPAADARAPTADGSVSPAQPVAQQWSGHSSGAGEPAWSTPRRRPQLRPLGGYGDYIMWFYRHHGLRLFAISLLASIPTLIVAVPVAVVTAEMVRRQRDLFLDPFGSALPDPDVIRQLEELNRPLFAIGAIATVISTLSFVAAAAAIAWYVTEVEAGRTPSIGRALDAIVDRLPAVTGLWLLFAGLLVLGQLFGYLMSAGSTSLLTETGRAAMLVIVGLLGFLAWIVIALSLAVRWMLAVPAAVVDDVTTRGALSRSWDWTQGNAWKLLGFLFVAGLAAFVVALVPVFISTLLLVPAAFSGASPLVVASAVANWLSSGLIVPIFAILAVRVYLDLRSQLAT